MNTLARHAVALMLLLGGVERVSFAADAGHAVDIGGRNLYLECSGAGGPVVVLEAGLRNRGDVWSATDDDASKQTMVFSGVAAFTRVCAYDRPGTTLGTDDVSRSDPVSQPRTTADAMADLHALLSAAAIPGPYVLVGHSTGGLIIRQYASAYPDELVGLVLVDAISEYMQDTMTARFWVPYDRLLLTDPPKELASYKDLETIDFDASFVQMRKAAEAHPLRTLPLVVISKGKPFGLPDTLPAGLADAVEAAWVIQGDRLAALLPGARHVIAANSSHYVMLTEPQLVIDAIRAVVEAARAGKPLR